MKNNTKFYTCLQNNSGGYLFQNDFVDLFVCVEANNVLEAKKIFKKILKKYRDYCPCCGFRWSDAYLTEDCGYNVPCIFGKPYNLLKNSFWFRGSILIYYLNGTKVKYQLLNNLFGGNNEKNI